MPPPTFRADSPVQPWLSAAAARDTVAALETEAGPERPWMTGFFLGLMAAGVIALMVIRVDVTVRTWGMVRARTENIELRSPVTASVDRVMVRTGDRVVAGQPLLTLANPALQARRETLAADRAHELQRVREWAALTARLREARGGFHSEPSPFATDWARRSWEEWVVSDDALARASARSRRESERVEALATRGLVSEHERDKARDAALADEQSRALASSRQTASWTAHLRDAERLVEKFAGELRQLDEELGLLTLRAPADGILMDLPSLQPGAVVAASQSLGAISTNDALRVETRAPARVFALIREGQRARLSVTALPSSEWGLIDAVVETLAPDASAGPAEPSYRVVLRPLQTGLHTRDGRRAALRKGFAAEVRFELGRATLLTLLRRNLADWMTGDEHPPAGRTSGRHARTQLFFLKPFPPSVVAG